MSSPPPVRTSGRRDVPADQLRGVDAGHQLFTAALDVDDLRWLRVRKLIVKGIQAVDDAQLVVDAGADAVVLSNHRPLTPLQLLPSVVAAVGDRTEVYVDTGITNGADVVAAVGLGARACLVGRAYL